MSQHEHPDLRIRWAGTNLATLITLYPSHGAKAVADKTGQSIDQVRSAVAYYGLRRVDDDGKPLRGAPDQVELFGLTKRELQVLRSVATGCGAKAAAKDLSMSVNNLNQHLGAIYRKLGVETMVAATLKAERAGMLDGVIPTTVDRWVTGCQGQCHEQN
jgi:DNA-binding NarL/FixJ family response regulator